MAKLNLSNIGPMSNLIINGDFNIWQRGTSFAAIVTGTYTADRWVYGKVGAMVHTITRDTDVPTFLESGLASVYSLKVDCTTVDSALAAGDHTYVAQIIEGLNASQWIGKTVTLSFWVKATKTGIYCVSLRNASTTESYVSEYTVYDSDTWEKKTVTIPMGSTWLQTNADSCKVYFTLAAGSTYNAATGSSWEAGVLLATSNQVNACDNTDNNFFLSQVKMEVGYVATPFTGRLYGEELALCQRYYQTDVINTLATCYNPAFIRISPLFWKVTMRSDPTAAYSSVAWLPSAAGFGTIGAMYSSSSTDQFANPIWNTVTGTEGHCGQITFTYTANAEL